MKDKKVLEAEMLVERAQIRADKYNEQIKIGETSLSSINAKINKHTIIVKVSCRHSYTT